MENKTIKIIKNRVSCRNYTDKKVPLSKLKLIAEAGMMAPSACNKQIANILILKDSKKVKKLRDLAIKELKRDCFYGASCMILVYANRNEKFAVQDCTCILENMFIAASSLNINSYWINQVDELLLTNDGSKIKKSLGIDNEARIVGTCILGYCANKDELKIKERKKDFIKIV